jgi:hypothetical protein
MVHWNGLNLWSLALYYLLYNFRGTESIMLYLEKMMLTLISCKKCDDQNYLLHTLCVTIEAMQILSEAFPDLMDSKK